MEGQLHASVALVGAFMNDFRDLHGHGLPNVASCAARAETEQKNPQRHRPNLNETRQPH